MLASVQNLDESRIALAGGADIIDLKNPAQGALGALPLADIRAIVRDVNGRMPVSATVGDLPMQPDRVADAARATAATGVDYVKVGFFSYDTAEHCLHALGTAVAKPGRLIAVLFADLSPPWRELQSLAHDAGFAGVMLDTARKGSGGLRDCMAESELSEFVRGAHKLGLLSGLAGSLRQGDVAPLLALAPDYLGFRTALCHQQTRVDALDPAAFDSIRARIPQPQQPEARALASG